MAKKSAPKSDVIADLKGGASPRGIAAYAWLDKKDTRFSKGDEKKSKYKVSLVVDKDDPKAAAFAASIQKAHADNEGRDKTCPVKDGDAKVDSDGKSIEEFANKWLISFQTSHPVKMIDSKKNPLPKGVSVWSGDAIKIAFSPIEYDTGATSGVSLRMGAVQLLEKNAGGAGVDNFDEEDGYEAPEAGAEGDDETKADDNGGDY